MNGEGERLSRAGSYVLGLMSETDRERAERDLEFDPAFREAVLKVAERMRVLDFAPQRDMDPADRWKAIAERINDMPQMRRFSDAPAVPARRTLPKRVKAVGQGLHVVPSWRAAAYAIGLIAAFAAGYIAARWPM